MKRGIFAYVSVFAAMVSAAADTDCLQINGSFEEVTSTGKTVGWNDVKPVFQFQSGVGRNGTRGLAYSNTDPTHYRFPSYSIPAKPGKSYSYEIWIRTEGLKGDESGATVCIEWSDAKGKWLGGSYADGVKGTHGEWEKIVGRTARLPDDAARMTVSPYVRRGMTGKAWFDDLVVREYRQAPVLNMIVSAYRNTVSDGPFTLYATLALEKGAEKAVKGAFTILTQEGKVVKQLDATMLTAESASVTLEAKTLPVGTYRVRFALAGQNGVIGKGVEIPLHRVARQPARRVWIDKHCRAMVDGKPFFPLGMYWGGIQKEKLDTYAKGPFNVLMPYQAPSKEQLDWCQEKGLKVIYSVKDIYSGTRWAPAGIRTEEDETRYITERVRLFKNHPAVLAWYLNDELPVTMLSRLTARQQLLERLDADHPTWVVLYQYDQIREYLPTFDVIGTDPYPIPASPIAMAQRWIRTTYEQTHRARALWQVPQAFDWGAYRKNPEDRAKTRAPTLEEMRCMAWQCIANGANGLIFYSFFDLYKLQDRNPFEKRWPEVCAMAEEIRKQIPILLSVEPAPQIPSPHDLVSIRTWRKEGKLYVAAVSASRDPVTVKVKLPFAVRKASSLIGTQPMADGKELTLSFRSIEPLFFQCEE